MHCSSWYTFVIYVSLVVHLHCIGIARRKNLYSPDCSGLRVSPTTPRRPGYPPPNDFSLSCLPKPLIHIRSFFYGEENMVALLDITALSLHSEAGALAISQSTAVTTL